MQYLVSPKATWEGAMILKRDSHLLRLEQKRSDVISALADSSQSAADEERLRLRLAEIEDAIEAIPANGADGLMVKWRYFKYWEANVSRGPRKSALLAFEDSLHRVVG
jgi:hypothetical protein